MKSFIKEFLVNLMLGLSGVIVISIWFGIIAILSYISDGILRVGLMLLYIFISAALVVTILNRADRRIK